MNGRRFLKGPIFWIVMAILLVLLGSSLLSNIGGPETIDTSQAVSEINQNQVEVATLIDRDQVLEMTLKDGTEVRTQYIVGQGVDLQKLLQAKADAGQLPGGYTVKVPSESILVTLLVSLLPIALIVLLLFFFMSQMQGGGNRIMNFGKSKAKAVSKDMPKTTFADVAGADEAV
jgi:cell division protease FtsH